MARNTENYKTYIIPQNMVDAGMIMGFKVRNIVEGDVMGVLAALLSLMIPITNTAQRISTTVIIASPFLFIGVIGINGLSITQFIRVAVHWLRNHGIILYDNTVRLLTKSSVDYTMEQPDVRDKIVDFWEKRRKSKADDEDEYLIEGVNFRFREDATEKDIIAQKREEMPILDAGDTPEINVDIDDWADDPVASTLPEDSIPVVADDAEETTFEIVSNEEGSHEQQDKAE